MKNISSDMKSHLKQLTKAERAMTIAVISHYGGEPRFKADCALALTIKSIAVLTDDRFRDDGLITFYEKHKDTTLLYALELSDQSGVGGIGAMMIANDKTEALVDYTANSFSDDLYDSHSKGHKKAVGYLTRYLMQQVATHYSDCSA